MSILSDNITSKGLTVVDNYNNLVGLFSYKDIKKVKDRPKKWKDLKDHLRVAAAEGTKTGTFERVDKLIKLGVNAIALDTTHGHSLREIEVLKEVKKKHPNIDVFMGNISPSNAVTLPINSGTNGVEIEVDPSSICTERVIDGVAILQLSAIFDVASVLKDKNDPKIANGGIRNSGDIVKAIAPCAHSKMVVSLFAEVEESHSHGMDITHEAPN